MTSKKNPSLKSLQFVHKVMLISQIIFAVIVALLVFGNKFTPPFQQYDRVLQLMLLLISFSGFYLGTFYILKRQIEKLKKGFLNPREKFSKFRRACIVQWTLIHGPCLLSIMCFLLVGNIAFLALAFTLMVLFAMMGPSLIKIQLLLELSEEDLASL